MLAAGDGTMWTLLQLGDTGGGPHHPTSAGLWGCSPGGRWENKVSRASLVTPCHGCYRGVLAKAQLASGSPVCSGVPWKGLLCLFVLGFFPTLPWSFECLCHVKPLCEAGFNENTRNCCVCHPSVSSFPWRVSCTTALPLEQPGSHFSRSSFCIGMSGSPAGRSARGTAAGNRAGNRASLRDGSWDSLTVQRDESDGHKPGEIVSNGAATPVQQQSMFREASCHQLQAKW